MLLFVCPTILFLACLTSAASARHAAGVRHPKVFARGSTSPQPDYACTSDMEWFGEHYNQEDCMAAVQRLWNVAVSEYETTQFEFLAPGAANTTTLPTVQTPQRYSSGQCTLAIVMLNTFAPGTLPGQKAGRTYTYSDSDVTSFGELWDSAGTIEMNCVLAQKQLGWAPGGQENSIGIFTWNTDSYWNRLIPFSPPNNSTSPQNATASLALATEPTGQEQLAESS